MTKRHITALLVALCAWFGAVGFAASQEQSREQRMARTLHDVCVASMLTGRAVDPSDFGDVLRVTRTKRDGSTELQQARGWPWVRVRVNRSATGNCVIYFSASGSSATGVELMGLLRRNERLARVTMEGAGWAYAPIESSRGFDSTRDPHMLYTLSGGMHYFIFERPTTTQR